VLTLVGSLVAGVWWWQSGAHQAQGEQAGVEALFRERMPDLAGRDVALADWRGQLLLVNFWASWCAPCREEMPALDALARKNMSGGVKVLGIAWDSAENVGGYLASAPVSYPVLLASKGASSLIAALGNPSQGMPFSVLISPSGKLLARHAGALSGEALTAWVQAHSLPNGVNMK